MNYINILNSLDEQRKMKEREKDNPNIYNWGKMWCNLKCCEILLGFILDATSS